MNDPTIKMSSDEPDITSLAVIMTCHNRRDTTLTCLRALYACAIPDGVRMQVYLVDDGSSDGTSAAVSSKFPQVNIIAGDGTLYWNGGMILALSEALKKSFDYYLWLNDDTVLYPDAIKIFLKCERDYFQTTGKYVLVVGSICDQSETTITYGGLVRANSWNRTKFLLLPESDEVQYCDTINGNCVLVPAQIAVELGNLEPGFAHGMGDIDYGLRAKQSGYELLVAPGYVAVCTKNTIEGGYCDRSLPFSARIKSIFSSKGLPLKTWFILTRRHAGVFWPIFFVWPYCRVVLSSLFCIFQKRFSRGEGIR